MLIRTFCAKSIGIDAVKVTVEVNIDRGIGIHLVGLADVAVKESLLRTTTALQSLGYDIPGKKIVINLAPADLHKSGSGYDLPIALGILAASGQKRFFNTERFLIIGELGLDGSVRDIPGALPFTELAVNEGLEGIILPEGSAYEAIDFINIKVFGVKNLNDAIKILERAGDCPELIIRKNSRTVSCGNCPDPDIPDFADIVGQEGAKRALEIAAAGCHNVLLLGSPGCGKSSLAKALAGILPPMSKKEALVTSKIYSIAGKGAARYGLMNVRPFRCPHYSASLPAMIGGGCGDNIMPGEISLAHNGVLFLDEFCQMPKSVTEALRAPLEDREVTISRLRSKVSFPASFMLVAASNPCPCGYWGEDDRCTCTAAQRINYLSRLSGPINDRIDLQVAVRSVKADELMSGCKGESSAAVALRVLQARSRQAARFKDEAIGTNSEMTNRMLEKYCPLDDKCREILSKLMARLGFSMRAYFRIIKVARTIADLSASKEIRPEHISEAAGYRFLDKNRL